MSWSPYGDLPVFANNSELYEVFIGPPRGSGWKLGEVALG